MPRNSIIKVLLTAQGKVRRKSIRGDLSLLAAQRASCMIPFDAHVNADGADGMPAHANYFRGVNGGVEAFVANRALLWQHLGTCVHNHGVVEDDLTKLNSSTLPTLKVLRF